MKMFAFVVIFVLLLTAAGAASDFSGKWSGSFVPTGSDGQNNNSQAFMDLKQSGTEITGTAGPSPEKQWTIMKGKVDGNKITFEVQSDEPLIRFELTLVDGHLKGEAKAEQGGRSMSATLDLQRTTK